ncbi:MAG: hypothetical protein GYB68_10145 [Chloroflexi bacterium]|nr:hypothetical protein [Chloroflexota bacterium]
MWKQTKAAAMSVNLIWKDEDYDLAEMAFVEAASWEAFQIAVGQYVALCDTAEQPVDLLVSFNDFEDVREGLNQLVHMVNGEALTHPMAGIMVVVGIAGHESTLEELLTRVYRDTVTKVFVARTMDEAYDLLGYQSAN